MLLKNTEKKGRIIILRKEEKIIKEIYVKKVTQKKL